MLFWTVLSERAVKEKSSTNTRALIEKAEKGV